MMKQTIGADRSTVDPALPLAGRGVLAAMVIAAASLAPPAMADDPSTDQTVVLSYAGSIARLRIVRAEVNATVSAERYDGTLMFRSAGLAGFFKTARIEAQGSGARGENGFAPESYGHVEVNGKKRREVALAWAADDVSVTATPPFGSPGDPAPTAQQRREALDPLAMVLQIAMAGGDEPCSRTVPVFDSKLRYDLVFEPDGEEEDLRTQGYRGPALRCRAFYRPIAGYDPEDLAEPEVYETPVRIWLAEVAPGVRVPALIHVRFANSILPFSVKLELQDAVVETSERPGGSPLQPG